jgi:hypothetical protein
MSYIASHVATIPTRGFEWYLIFLEGPFTDEIKKEIDAHFVTLGREIGKDALVVRGFDPTAFRESVFEAPAFYDVKWNVLTWRGLVTFYVLFFIHLESRPVCGF